MSELIDARRNQKTIRWQLLTTASMLALLPYVWIPNDAKADSDGTDRPTVWIELGGQLQRQTGQGDVVVQPFVVNYPTSPAFLHASPLHTDKAPLYSIGGDGKITFQPDGSDWLFLASVRYGRSSGDKAIQQRAPGHRVEKIQHWYNSANGTFYRRIRYVTPPEVDFSTTNTTQNQSSTIVDFQAGRDVGIGLFGRDAFSAVNFGVRFAQFASRTSFAIHAAPDVKTFNAFGSYLANLGYYYPGQSHHSFAASGKSARSFHGVGPSISWNGNSPVIGNPDTSELEFDWGVSAAVLFGRQRAAGNHSTRGYHFPTSRNCNCTHPPSYARTGNFNRARTVTVPNVGGFAGISFRYSDAKVSFGYRGDFFFDAMDAGNDTRKVETVGFYGPFASISIGLGG